MTDPREDQPRLLNAASLAEADVGSCEWDRDHKSLLLTVSPDGRTIEWGPRTMRVWQKLIPVTRDKFYPPAWVPASTRMHLHSGTFRARPDRRAGSMSSQGISASNERWLPNARLQRTVRRASRR